MNWDVHPAIADLAGGEWRARRMRPVAARRCATAGAVASMPREDPPVRHLASSRDFVGRAGELIRTSGGSVTVADLGPLLGGIVTAAPVYGAAAEPSSAEPSRVVSQLAEELAKTKMFETVLACICRLAETSPVVLVFEDVHWADSASAELIGFMTRNLGHSRVLLVVTYRTEELGLDHPLRPWLTELARHARTAHVRLHGLDRDEMAGLIARLVEATPAAALVDSVWSRSNGNPFFAEELVATGGEPPLSAELEDVIMTRVAGCTPDAQQLLRVIAAVGDTADHELLVATAGLDGDALEEALGDAMDRSILVVDVDGDGSGDAYRFRHTLFQEAVHESLRPAQRRRLHGAIADALTNAEASGRLRGRDAATVAGHRWASGEWGKSYLASMRAADAAVAVWAFPEALAHLDRARSAAELMPPATSPGRADRRRLSARTADVAHFAGAGQRSVDLAREAIDTADDDTDPTEVAELHLLLGRNVWGVGDPDAAFDAYRRAAACVSAEQPSVALARILAEEARGLMLMSRLEDAQRRSHEGLAVADAVGAARERGHITCTLAVCRGQLGFHDEGIGLARQALLVAEQHVDPDDLNRAYANLGSLLTESGRLEESAALVFDSAAVCEELWGVKLDGVAVNSVDALIRLGRFDDAEALLLGAGERALGSCSSGPSLHRAVIAARRPRRRSHAAGRGVRGDVRRRALSARRRRSGCVERGRVSLGRRR